MEDMTIFHGSEIKMLDDGKIGGYLVRFENPDIEGDYFTKSTNFGDAKKTPVWFHHRQPFLRPNGEPIVVKEQIGEGELKYLDDGVFVEAVLYNRKRYEKVLDYLGWSSGTSPHLVERKSVGNAAEIEQWLLGQDASLTFKPADPKNTAYSIKSIENQVVNIPELKSLLPEIDTDSGAANAQIEILSDETDKEQNDMSEKEEAQEKEVAQDDGLKALQDTLTEQSVQIKALTDFIQGDSKEAKHLRDVGYVTPDDEDDSGTKSMGDWLVAIANGNDRKLAAKYATKAHTSTDGQSLGYAVPEGFMPMLDKAINLTSGVINLVDRQPVNAPSGRMPVPDFSVVPTAGAGETAEAAGITNQARQEGGAYVEETAKLEQIRWNVTDAVSGYAKASKELSQYAPAIENFLRRMIANSIGAKKEYFILLGTGVAQPLGITNWGGSVAITPATNDVFAVADSDNMMARHLVAGAQPVWVIHPSIFPDIAAMERGTGAGTFQANIAQSYAQTLHGLPIIKSQHLPQANASGAAWLADFSQYTLFEYGPIYVDFSEHADFLNGNNVWRFGQLLDGKPNMTAAVTLAGAGTAYTLSPFVYHND